MKKNILKIISASALLSASVLSNTANATLITTINPTATSHAFTSNASNTVVPISENGFTWSATNNGYYGYDSSWGLNSNGSWNNMNLIGLNSLAGSMTITFDSLVSNVLAFVSYSPSYSGASIAIYDLNNVLLESFSLAGLYTGGGSNSGWNYGFSRHSADIKSIKFSNAYIVASNLRSFVSVPTQSQSVPAPSMLVLFALGLAGLFSRRLIK